jgi:Sulfotransferase family
MYSDKIKILPIVFIVGRGRSGSTLLASMLNNHPQMIVPEESRFVQELYYKFANTKKWTDKKKHTFYTEVFRGFEQLDIDREELIGKISKLNDDASFAKIIQQVYLSVRNKNEKTSIQLIGDKNPKYTFWLETLLKIFPQAKFIHITRDYRDSYLSFMRVDGMRGEKKNLAFQLYRWNYYHKRILNFKKKIDGAQYYHLKYEDLVSDTETALKKLSEFLHFSYNKEMIRLPQIKREGVRAKIHQSLNQSITSSKIDEWEEQMNKKQQVKAIKISEKTASSLSYEINAKYLRFPAIVNLFMYVLAIFPLFFKAVFFRANFLMKMIYNFKKKKNDKNI